MITQRFENFKFGTYDTVQTFYRCSWCKEETNVVEWHIHIGQDGQSVYNCPVCAIKHVVLKGE